MIHKDFIENLKTVDLIFYSHDLLLEALIQKYGGRRIDDKSAVIIFVYDPKYVEGWVNLNIPTEPIIIECYYDTFGLIRNSGDNFTLIERLIEEEISHEVLENTIVINQPCYGVQGKMAEPNPNNIFSKLDWNITAIDTYNDKLFLYYLNLMCQASIEIKTKDNSIQTISEEIKKTLNKPC